MKINQLPQADQTFYRDNLLVALILNTSRNDKEAFGTLIGLILRCYDEFKELDKRKGLE